MYYGKHPIVGVGPDNLAIGVKTNINQESDELEFAMNSNIDKAHNEYLQIAVTMGIPALILYLGFICMLIFPRLKKIFVEKKYFILFCMIISYMAQAFFNISVVGVAPIFWITLGLFDNENIDESSE